MAGCLKNMPPIDGQGGKAISRFDKTTVIAQLVYMELNSLYHKVNRNPGTEIRS